LEHTLYKVINSWGFDSGLSITVISTELEEPLNIVNIYRPCQNRDLFWDKTFSKYFLKEHQVILGGDLNFSLGFSEVWGTHARTDPLTSFFTQKLAECNFLDLEPIKLKPTWRNNRVGEAGVAKRLDRFLIKDILLKNPLQMKQWIGHGGISDHYLIFLEVRKGSNKPPSPFKFNRTVRENWSPFTPGSNCTTGLHFVKNLQRLKDKTKSWAYHKLLSEDLELKDMENQLKLLKGAFLLRSNLK